MPRAATSLSLTSCDDAVAIYALLLGGAHSSRGNGPEKRLKLRIADAIALDPATRAVQAHYFTSKQGVVMRKNRSSLGLHEVLQSLLDGLVRAPRSCCVQPSRCPAMPCAARSAFSLPLDCLIA
jgi:hypothetical protein